MALHPAQRLGGAGRRDPPAHRRSRGAPALDVRDPLAVVASTVDLRDVTASVAVVPDAAFSPVEALQAVGRFGTGDLQLAAAWEVGG